MAGDQSAEHRSFSTTQWTRVEFAADPNSPERRQALNDVIERYRPALITHLIRRKRINFHDAEEHLSNFLAKKVFEDDLLARADRNRGRFRNFLLTTLDNFVISEHRYASAKSRRPAHLQSLEPGMDPPDEDVDPARLFDVVKGGVKVRRVADEKCSARCVISPARGGTSSSCY